MVLVAFILTLFVFASLAIFFSVREEKVRKILKNREQELNRKLYEVAILKEISERIGYSLDIEKIVDIITGSIRNLFPYSTVSSLFLTDEEISFKTYVEESISHEFLDSVKNNMLASIKALTDDPLPVKITESLSGVVLDDTNKNPVRSFFNIPLVIRGQAVGLISISSQKVGLYKEEEMSILYRITKQASSAVEKLEIILETEKGKLMSMISSLADGVFMVDPDTKLAVINPKAREMLGIVARNNPTIFDIIGSLTGKLDIRTKIEQAMQAAIGKLISIPEVKLREDLIVQVFITPVVDKGGVGLGAAVLLHDITQEKSLAQMKEDFTNMVVHELRAPLTAIKQASMLLLGNKLDEEKDQKFLSMIRDSSDNLLNVVSSLLDAAKLEAGKFTVTPALGNIEEVIRERVEFFKPLVQSKNVTVSLEIEPLREIYFDRARVIQIIDNLVSNALKFTKEGGNITIVAHEENGEVKISVKDTGVGIPKEKQAMLFSKFSQVHPTTGSGPYGGTGLGLFITRGIVEAHGGKINLESQVGRGTTVTFTLPEKPILAN